MSLGSVHCFGLEKSGVSQQCYKTSTNTKAPQVMNYTNFSNKDTTGTWVKMSLSGTILGVKTFSILLVSLLWGSTTSQCSIGVSVLCCYISFDKKVDNLLHVKLCLPQPLILHRCLQLPKTCWKLWSKEKPSTWRRPIRPKPAETTARPACTTASQRYETRLPIEKKEFELIQLVDFSWVRKRDIVLKKFSSL